MSWFTVKDSRGRESRTLFLVAVSWLFISTRFVLATFHGVVPALNDIPPFDPMEYAKATGVLLALWLSREWIDKAVEPGVD